ncbi:MAG: hypothetical protein KDB03_13055 [Planctomycetales bacterium]|nr:hypothetical protein [Planctomycetales bacterium]
MKLPPPIWQQLLQMSSTPGRFLFAFGEFVVSWFTSRRWGAVLALAPFVILSLVMLGMTAYAGLQGNSALLDRYWQLVEKQTELDLDATTSDEEDNTANGPAASSTADRQLTTEEDISPFAQLLLKRILEIDDSNIRATYLVASQLATQGRFGQARLLMRKIAPEGIKGFAPAHAWLAADRLMRVPGKLDPAQRSILENDFALAATWNNTSPMLLKYYADFLISEKRIVDAVSILRIAAKKMPELELQIAAVAHEFDRRELFNQTVEQIRLRVNSNVAQGIATALDMSQMASLALLEEKIDEAIRAAQQGLAMKPDAAQTAQLRRLLSSCFIIKYSKSSTDESKRDLSFLDLALRADPTDPKVTEQIALLISQGFGATTEMNAFLEEQLRDGKASAMAHILLANGKLLKQEFESASTHFELALRMAPNSPVVLNNYALCLIRSSPGNPEILERSESMLARALQIAGANPEMLDSLGEVMLAKQDYVKAIQALEGALQFDTKRANTRRRLVMAYEGAGLPDMAEIQRKWLVENSGEN